MKTEGEKHKSAFSSQLSVLGSYLSLACFCLFRRSFVKFMFRNER